MKQREGTVERVQDANTVIGKGMFKKETDLTLFTVRAGAARGVTSPLCAALHVHTHHAQAPRHVTTVCSTPRAHAPCMHRQLVMRAKTILTKLIAHLTPFTLIKHAHK